VPSRTKYLLRAVTTPQGRRRYVTTASRSRVCSGKCSTPRRSTPEITYTYAGPEEPHPIGGCATSPSSGAPGPTTRRPLRRLVRLLRARTAGRHCRDGGREPGPALRPGSTTTPATGPGEHLARELPGGPHLRSVTLWGPTQHRPAGRSPSPTGRGATPNPSEDDDRYGIGGT